MHIRGIYWVWLAFLGILLAAGCGPGASSAPTAGQSAATAATAVEALPSATLEAAQTETPLPAPAASAQPSPTRTATATATAQPTLSAYGPEFFPAGVNPLSGQGVSDAKWLDLPPALISISNFPVTARPQSGLTVTPLVYEVYTGYGMTRFLAVVYGEMNAADGKPAIFGPIRSGRLPYEPLRALLGGFLMIASGDESVLEELKMYTNVWNPASNDVNGVLLDSQVVRNLAKEYAPALGRPALTGMLFSVKPPQGWKTARQLWIPYSGLNQVLWKYDAKQDGYLRYQDNYDGATMVQATDRQSGKPLVYENVVVIFAPHRAIKDEKIEIGLGGTSKAPGLLLRDGVMSDISWSSVDSDYFQQTGRTRVMRFSDAQGNPVALKPGQTWVEVVTSGSPVFETVDSMKPAELYYKKQAGSGAWAVQFLQPVVGK